MSYAHKKALCVRYIINLWFTLIYGSMYEISSYMKTFFGSMYEISSYMKTFFGSMYGISSYMKTFFGSMYEISSCYDRGFLIDEIMLYLIMYELFHDPYVNHVLWWFVKKNILETFCKWPYSWMLETCLSRNSITGSSLMSWFISIVINLGRGILIMDGTTGLFILVNIMLLIFSFFCHSDFLLPIGKPSNTT